MEEVDREMLYQEYVSGENLLSPSYSVAYRHWKWRRLVLEETLAEIRARKGALRILEVGCDRGRDLFNLDTLLGPEPPHRFVGLDVSPTIRFCRERARREGRSRFEFVQASCEKLPFEDGAFDLVWCQEVVEHLPAPELLVKELHRVAKPGGLVLVTTPNGENAFGRLSRIFHRRPARIDPRTLPMTVVDAEVSVYGHISVLPWRRWVEIAVAAGFTVERVRRGSALIGGPREDGHQLLFAGLLVLDWLLDCLPGTNSFCEQIALVLRKPR